MTAIALWLFPIAVLTVLVLRSKRHRQSPPARVLDGHSLVKNLRRPR